MKTQLSREALAFGDVVRSALERSGGFDLLRLAEVEPAERQRVKEVLADIGVWDLRPCESVAELEAAAIACHACGALAVPYPIAERLSASQGHGQGALALVGLRPRVNMADLDLGWTVGDLALLQARVTGVGPRIGGKLGAFVCPVEVGPWAEATGIEMSITLQCWVLLGMVESAAEMTYAYVQARHQFGRPLSSNQGVQFRLTDVAVATQSLTELAKFTWSIARGVPNALTDAVALRLASLEAAELVFSVCHQMHGAIAFCDETALSGLSRFSQPVRRLPGGRSHTERELLRLSTVHPIDSPFAGASARPYQ